MSTIRYLPMLLTATLMTAPVHASQGGIVLPEPSSLFLLGMGVAGVVLGRKFSSKKDGD